MHFQFVTFSSSAQPYSINFAFFPALENKAKDDDYFALSW